MSRISTLKPVNRHLLVVPHFSNENKTESGVFLPEDFNVEASRFIKATVVDIAEDCSREIKSIRGSNYSESKNIVVDSSMIEEVEVDGKKNYIILENYVIAIMRDL